MKLTIEQVNNKRELKKFIGFQYDLYKDNKYYIPPLRFDEFHTLSKDKNPAFDFCEAKYWMAFRNNKIVGRIAGIINHKFCEKWNKKEARFGWIDFIDDEEVSSTLLSTAENWAKEKGMESIHGPLGFTDMDGEGMLIEGYEEESTLGSIYNFPYYPNHIERNNYTKDVDWIEYNMTVPDSIPEKIERIAEISAQRNKLTLLDLKNPKEVSKYAYGVFHLINETYKDLYGFVELTDKQIDSYVKQYFSFVRPQYVPIIVDEDGKVAGFGITMPSLNKALKKINGKIFPFGFIHLLMEMKRSKNLDLYLTAVRSDLQNKGVNAMLIHHITKIAIANKIVSVETNRELESNVKVQSQWKFFDTRQHKRRRCYKKSLA